MMAETVSFGRTNSFWQNIRFRPKFGFFRQLFFSFGVSAKNLFWLSTSVNRQVGGVLSSKKGRRIWEADVPAFSQGRES